MSTKGLKESRRELCFSDLHSFLLTVKKMQKYRSSLGLLVGLLVVGAFFPLNSYAIGGVYEQVTLSVTGMT